MVREVARKKNGERETEEKRDTWRPPSGRRRRCHHQKDTTDDMGCRKDLATMRGILAVARKMVVGGSVLVSLRAREEPLTQANGDGGQVSATKQGEEEAAAGEGATQIRVNGGT